MCHKSCKLTTSADPHVFRGKTFDFYCVGTWFESQMMPTILIEDILQNPRNVFT